MLSHANSYGCAQLACLEGGPGKQRVWTCGVSRAIERCSRVLRSNLRLAAPMLEPEIDPVIASQSTSQPSNTWPWNSFIFNTYAVMYLYWLSTSCTSGTKASYGRQIPTQLDLIIFYTPTNTVRLAQKSYNANPSKHSFVITYSDKLTTKNRRGGEDEEVVRVSRCRSNLGKKDP